MSNAKTVDWRKAHPADVALIFGPEDFFATEATRTIREALRQKHSMLEISEVDASSYQAGQLLNLASPSLFSEPRLILISNAEKCTDAFIEDGKRYLTSPAPDTTVIIRHNGSSVRGKALLDAIRASELAIEIACPKTSKDHERTKFVTAQFAAANRRVTDSAVRAMVGAFRDDVSELAQAIEQILQDSSENITEEIVDRYFGGRVEADAFKVLDLALMGRNSESLLMLRHALATGQDPVYLVGSFAYKIRQIARVVGNPRITLAEAKMDSFALTRAKKDAQGWDDEGVGRVMQAIADADAAAKGGDRNPEFRLEQLLMLICNRGRTA